MPLEVVVRLGERFVRWHSREAAAAGRAPGRESFAADWESFLERRPDLLDIEVAAVRAYADAALFRDNRTRVAGRPVWLDAKGRVRHTPPPWPEEDCVEVQKNGKEPRLRF